MDENSNGTNHDDRLISQTLIPPPPPSERPGWLSHTVLQPTEFPQSSVPYLYSLSDGDLPTISSSPAFNLHLLNTHPAYAPPPAINGSSRTGLPETSRYPWPPYTSATTSETTNPSLREAPDLHRYNVIATDRDLSPQAQSQTALLSNGFSHSHDQNAVVESIETDTPWNTSFTELLEGSGSQAWHHQQNGFDPVSSYSADAFAPIPQNASSLLTNAPHLTHYRTDIAMPGDDNDSELDETDSEEDPGQNWPGRHRKRAAEEPVESAALSQPRKKRKQKQMTGEKSKGRKKGANVGPRPTLDPGDAFMKIYNQAVDIFLAKKDLDRAQTLVIEAISTNPEIFAAHSLLADIHFARGNHDAGIDVLMVGLHAHTNDVELWRQVADTILLHSGEGSQKRIERAMYCYGAIIRKNKLDLDARFQRAECARLLGIWNRAFSDLNMVMNDDPHNSAVLAQFAKLCRDVGDIPKAVITYEKHFDYYRTLGLSEEEHFTWQDVGTYVDLLLKQGETAEAMVKMKQLGRWLCGREDEVFWDEHLSDDRELDQMHYPRRLEEPRFIPNLYPEQDYGEAFPLDLRGKLGVMRLKLGYREEAQSHFDWLEPDLEGEESLVEEYSDTFYEIAKALHDAKEHEQALHFYKALYNEGVELSLDFYMDMGASCYICKEKEVAIELYLKVLELDSDNIDARTELTKCYRDLGNKELAIKYGKEGVLMAQSMVSDETVVRKYERREDRERREEAERALKSAFRLPDKGKNKPGKVPRGLRYRTRERRKFFKWVPDPTPSPEPIPEPRQPRYKVSRKKKKAPAARQTESPEASGSSSESPDPAPVVEEPPLYDRPIKVPRKPGRPAKKKEARRPPRQENAIKHYEEMQQLYQTLLNHQEAMRDDDEVAVSVWMDCANAMFQDFRSRRLFFPVARHSKFTGYTNMEPQPRAATPASTGARTNGTPEGTPARETPEPNGTRQRSVQAGTAIPKEAATAPDEYCGITFAAWLDIFLELAVLHANSAHPDGQTECYKLINACLDCSIYHHDDRAMVQIHACYLSCCLALGDDITLYNTVLRWFMREYAFCTDTYRLYSAITLVNELQPVANPMTDAVFKSGPNQKFIFRQIISIDKMLPQDYNKDGPEGGVPAFMRRDREETKKLMAKVDRTKPANNAEEDDGDDATQMRSREVTAGLTDAKLHMPQEMDIVLFVLYAHIMMASGSFPNALSYLYRANCLDPHNTVCLLSIALCYMHELAKRQTENRHAYALAGWAWFGRYEEERIKWAEELDRKRAEVTLNGDNSANIAGFRMIDVARREIAFNKARCWEMLGMTDLSMRGYKRVLDLGLKEKPVDIEAAEKTEVEEVEEEWTMEAAYAMSVMYAMSGNTEKAREVTERYLVVE